MSKTRVFGSDAIAYVPPSPPPPPPPARMSRSDPSSSNPPVVCEPATESFPVTSLPSTLAVDANEFKRMHSIGISMYTFRSNQRMSKIGPGSYDTEKGLELVSPRSPRWSTATTSPRMSLVKKSSEEQEADERLSLRKNLLSMRTLFLPEFERRDAANGSASPRWLRPTRSASSRREEVAAATASHAQHAAAVPTPMRYADAAPSQASKRRDPTADETGRVVAPTASGVEGTALAFDKRAPRPPSGATARNRNVHGPPVPPTPQEKEASIRSTLSRPSSASVRYQQHTKHWVNGMQRDTAVAGVMIGNPRDGKTDALYDIDKGVAATACSSPRVSLGTCPRFPGDAPVPKPRPTSAVRTPGGKPL